jgi:hypothetical protein
VSRRRVPGRRYDGHGYGPYITNRGNRGIELDNSEFGQLAEVLYDECEWEPFEIKSRLKHYEGWRNHDWA